MEILEIEEKKFRKRLMGLDPDDVETFLRDIIEEFRRFKEENQNLKRDMQTLES